MNYNFDYSKYKLIYIYGDSDEISRIISEIKKLFHNFVFQRLELKDEISSYLLSNDMFQEKKIFLIENITQTFLKNKKLFSDDLQSSNHILILTSEEYQQITFDEKIFLQIEAKRQTFKEKNLYINDLIEKNNLTINQTHKTLIKHLLLNENFLTIENEINKLRLFMKNKNFQLIDEIIYDLFHLPSKNIINDLIEKILFKQKESFEILYKIINKYDAILIIRSLYNYFLKLQKVFISVILEKKPFDLALNEQYGLLIGMDKNSIKEKLKSMSIQQVNNILNKIVNCEIQLKKENDRSIAIFERFLIDII